MAVAHPVPVVVERYLVELLPTAVLPSIALVATASSVTLRQFCVGGPRASTDRSGTMASVCACGLLDSNRFSHFLQVYLQKVSTHIHLSRNPQFCAWEEQYLTL